MRGIGMKVGLVSPYDFASPGGVNDHVQHLAGQVRQLGHEVRIFAPSSRADIDFDTREFYRIGSPIAVPANDSVARITLSFHLGNRVAAIIEQERFDVLHFHEPLMPALPLTMLRMSTTAHVGTFHAFSHSNIGYYYGRGILQHTWIASIAASRSVSRRAHFSIATSPTFLFASFRTASTSRCSSRAFRRSVTCATNA